MYKTKLLCLFGITLLGILLLTACRPAPALINGDDKWKLVGVTYPASVETPGGGTLTPKDANFKLIRAEFECLENKSLIGVMLGKDASTLGSMSMANGFPNIYITSDDGNKYSVYMIETCAIVGSVPVDGSGFSLEFKDLEPVPLDL